MSIYRFEEGYVERMWGGHKLRDVLSKPTPRHETIGEAWLISDHPQHVSRVAEGNRKGTTLSELIRENADYLLGSIASLTPHGRFPLLLKLLDAGDKLSVQVHPDDDTAVALKEPDVGKTEMWHCLQADSGAQLYCGLSPSLDKESFRRILAGGNVVDELFTFDAVADTTVFVPAGTVHAIGGGSLLAEIQQNSDITYRLDDWGRVQADGTPRKLHVDKGISSIHFGSTHNGAAKPLTYDVEGAQVSVLAACRYFAAEEIQVDTTYTRDTHGDSFFLLLGKSGSLTVESVDDRYGIDAGQALLVSGGGGTFSLAGSGRVLAYYVPDLNRDIVIPLRRAGHGDAEISALGGDPASSDIPC